MWDMIDKVWMGYERCRRMEVKRESKEVRREGCKKRVWRTCGEKLNVMQKVLDTQEQCRRHKSYETN